MQIEKLFLLIAILVGTLLSAHFCFQGDKGKTLDQGIVTQSTALAAGESLLVSGDVDNFGSRGTFDLYLSADGRFLQVIDAEIGEEVAYDGARGWVADQTQLVRDQSRSEWAWAYLRANATGNNWNAIESRFRVQKSGYDMSSSGETWIISDNQSPFEATLKIDPATNLIAEIEYVGGFGHELMKFSNYADTNGVLVASKIVQTLDGIDYRVINITHRERLNSLSEAIYRPSQSVPDDYQFDLSVSPELEVRKTAAGHFLVRPIIDGIQMGWFFLDTGASVSTIDKSAVHKLNLSQVGQIPLLSIFGRVEAPVYSAHTLSLGPITIMGTTLTEMDLAPFNQALGEEIEGVIGYPLFARSIIEIDISKDRVLIHDPATFQLDAGHWEELILDSNHPIIRASFEGNHEGTFRLDIGAGQSNVVFHTETVDALNMLAGKETIEQDVGIGVIAVGELGWIEFAETRFENIPAAFSRAESGPFADNTTNGNIGVGLLSNFTLIFDYQNARIAFIPKEN